MGLNKILVNNDAVVNTGIVYDITKATSKTYETLAEALGTNGNNVPPENREGGMSIRFVQTSDNKYVQARCTATTFSTNVSDWQEVDEKSTLNSKNLAESGGIYDDIFNPFTDGIYINDSGLLRINSDWCIASFTLPSAIQANDVIVWSGITSNGAMCMVGLIGNTLIPSAIYGANGNTRTVTIPSSSSWIGATRIMASFLVSKKAEAGITINGTKIAPDATYKAVEKLYPALLSKFKENFVIRNNSFGNGVLRENSNWCVGTYHLTEAIKEGDIILWNGAYADANALLAFYDSAGNYMMALSATGLHRTITIASGAAAIGATIIKASFYKSNTKIAELRLNNTILDPDIQYLSNEIIDKTLLSGAFNNSDIDNIKNVGVYIRNPYEDQNNRTFLSVNKVEGTVIQTILSDGGIFQRKYIDGSWSEWNELYVRPSQLGSAAVKNVDVKPTYESTKLVESGGVWNEENAIFKIHDAYVFGTGYLKTNNNWFVYTYHLTEAIKEGDIILWEGISADANRCIGFFLNGTLKGASSATGSSRTLTVAAGSDFIGANEIKASFAVSNAENARVSINGVLLQPDSLKTYNTYKFAPRPELWVNGIDKSYELDRRLNVHYIKGDGITRYQCSIDYLEKGRKYKLRLLYWPSNTTGLEYTIFSIDNYVGSTGTSIFAVTAGNTPQSEYVFEVPTTSDYIAVTGKAVDGEYIYFSIEPYIEDEVKNSLNPVSSKAVYDAVTDKASQYGYLGRRIELEKGNFFDMALHMTITYPTESSSGQGCVNWGNKLLVGGANGYIRIYDLDSHEPLVLSVELGSASEHNHVNNLCWGVEGDTNNNEFPKYLYVSECGSNSDHNRCFVENFTSQGSTLVQTIQYNPTVAIPFFQWVVDTDNGYIYIIGQTTLNPDDQNAKRLIRKFKLPSISAGTTVVLEDSDVISEHEYDGTYEYMYIAQGAFYNRGKIYLCTGGHDNGQHTMPHRIFVIDLLNYEVVSMIDVGQAVQKELEAVCVYKGKLLCCYPNQYEAYLMTL